MDTQPKIPTLKDSQKPQVKVRGLQAGVTLLDRLKQFKKKDLAFILAGLGTLFMAPLAEHFMMSPETGEGTLQQGWKGNGSSGHGMFDGSGSSPYEPGTTGLAPGGAIGGGSDIITPLNVRDPSALVMGPGATQQPPTNSVMPSTPPPTAPVSHSDSDLKDALAASARGVGAAAHAVKSLLPVPKISLAGGGSLRGLGVANGGSSASASVGGVSSAGLAPNRAQGSNSLGSVRPTKGYSGVARGQTNGGSGLDALKKAAGDAANNFGASRSATADLANAAAQPMPGGSGNGGLGAGGSGATDKPDSGNSIKDGKNVGESLAFLKQKAMQEAQIALWAKEQEAGDNKLEALKIRNSVAESIAGTIGTAIGNYVTCGLQAGQSYATCLGSAGPELCDLGADGSGGPTSIPASAIVPSGAACNTSPGSAAKGPTGETFYLNGTSLYACPISNPPNLYAIRCSGGAKGGNSPAPDPGSVTNAGAPQTSPTTLPNADVGALAALCTKAQGEFSGLVGPTTIAADKPFYTAVETQAVALIAARDAMYNGPTKDAAGCSLVTPLQNNLNGYSSALSAATAAKNNANDAATQMSQAVGGDLKSVNGDMPGKKKLSDAKQNLIDAAKIMSGSVTSDMAAAQATIPTPPPGLAGTALTDAQTYGAQLSGVLISLQTYQGALNNTLISGATIDAKQKELDAIINTDPTSTANAAPTVKAAGTANTDLGDPTKTSAQGGATLNATDPTLKQILTLNSNLEAVATLCNDAATCNPPNQSQSGGAPATPQTQLANQLANPIGGAVGANVTQAMPGSNPSTPNDAATAVEAYQKNKTDSSAKSKAGQLYGQAVKDVQGAQSAQSSWLTNISSTLTTYKLPQPPSTPVTPAAGQ